MTIRRSQNSTMMGASWGHLGGILGHLGASWGILGASWGHLGPPWGMLPLSFLQELRVVHAFERVSIQRLVVSEAEPTAVGRRWTRDQRRGAMLPDYAHAGAATAPSVQLQEQFVLVDPARRGGPSTASSCPNTLGPRAPMDPLEHIHDPTMPPFGPSRRLYRAVCGGGRQQGP